MAHAGKLKEKRGDIRFEGYFVPFFDRIDIEGFFRKTIRVVQQQQLLL